MLTMIPGEKVVNTVAEELPMVGAFLLVMILGGIAFRMLLKEFMDYVRTRDAALEKRDEALALRDKEMFEQLTALRQVVSENTHQTKETRELMKELAGRGLGQTRG